MEQATQVAEGCVQALQMNVQGVYHTLNNSNVPQVLDTATGKLEFYQTEGNLTFYIYTKIITS